MPHTQKDSKTFKSMSRKVTKVEPTMKALNYVEKMKLGLFSLGKCGLKEDLSVLKNIKDLRR